MLYDGADLLSYTFLSSFIVDRDERHSWTL
jgi:hypothetical protein